MITLASSQSYLKDRASAINLDHIYLGMTRTNRLRSIENIKQ